MNLHHALIVPVLDDAYAKVTAGAHTGAYGANDLKTPSEAQAQAGTYKMGRVTVQGLRIAIEQPCGSIRSGKGVDGKEWSSRMAAHYGYFEGTRGADGDGIDCFVGPYPESEQVFVINQRNPGGGFDEHKVLIGFASERHARGAYLDSYERGWRGLQSLVPISLDQLRWWIKHGKKSIALTAESLPQQGTNPMNPKITWNEALPDSISLDQVLYQLRRMDGTDGLLLDSLTMAEIMEDTDGVIALDALVVENAQLTRMAERLRAIMDRSGGTVKAPAVQVSEPFRARGVTNIAAVFELSDGQTVSVFFHNPDTAPNKLAPGDEMISWKWLLNKKDITIVVAPEKGQDLNPRLVASRIMRLAEKNSPAFQKANAKRAERMSNIEAIRGRIAEKEATLTDLVAQVEAARLEKDQRVIAAEDEARMKGAQPQKGDSFTIVAWYGDDRSGERDLALNESTKEKALETARKRIAFDLETKTFGLPSLVRWYYRPSHKYGEEIPAADLMPAAPEVAEPEQVFPDPHVASAPVAEFIAAGFKRVQSNDYARSNEAGDKKLSFNIRLIGSRFKLVLTIGFPGGFTGGRIELGSTDDAQVALDVIERELSRRKEEYGDAGQEGAEQTPSQRVDAAYQFANATDAFKERVAGSIDKTDYSEFATAKAMDMKAKSLGAEIHWGMGAALDSVHPASKYKFEKGEKVKHAKTGDILTVIRSVRPGGYVFVEELQDAVSPQDLLIKKDGGFAALDGVSVAELGHAPAYTDGTGKWHSYTMEAMKYKDDAALRFIIKDATEAAEAGEKMNNPKAGQYRDEAHYASMELQRRRKGGKQIMDSAVEDDDDFDPAAEFDACPVEDGDLDGDFKGHPFRGNQHKKASSHSHAAVRASMSAKYAEKDGDTKGAKSAHKSAHYSHMAAAEGTTGKARKYHRKMAKFHGSRAGMTLDSVTFDDASDYQDSIVGNIKKDSLFMGRAVIQSDGKAIIYQGKSDHGEIPVNNENGEPASFGDDPAELVEWLLVPAAPAFKTSDKWVKKGASEYEILVPESVGLRKGARIRLLKKGAKWYDPDSGAIYATLLQAQKEIEEWFAKEERTRAEEAASRAESEAFSKTKTLQPAAPVEVYAFKDASEEALGLLRIGAQNPAARSTYKTAVSVEQAAESHGMAIHWEAVASIPAMDDASGGLFGDGDSGYIRGDLAYNGNKLASIYLRDDGMVNFELQPDMSTWVDLEEEGWAGWHDAWTDVISKLRDVCDENGIFQKPASQILGEMLVAKGFTQDRTVLIRGDVMVHINDRSATRERSYAQMSVRDAGAWVAPPQDLDDFVYGDRQYYETWSEDEMSAEASIIDENAKVLQEWVDSNASAAPGDSIYAYTVTEGDGGWRVKFKSPEMSQMGNWNSDKDAAIAKAEIAIDIHKNSPYLAKRWNSPRGMVQDVRLSGMPTMGEGTETYDVLYADGATLRFRANDFDQRVQEDEFNASPEGIAAAKARAEKYEADKAAHKAAEEAARAEDERLNARIKAFTDAVGYSPINAGKAREVLKTKVNFREFGVITRLEFVEKSVAAGRGAGTDEVKKIKDKSRREFNRMSNEEQRAHERKQAEAGTKTEYLVGDYVVTKVEYDYANYLIGQKATSQPSPAQESAVTSPKTEDRAFLMTVIDGSHPEILEPELADKLAQAYERHAGDAEITSLFMQAGNAYTQAMLAATEGV